MYPGTYMLLSAALFASISVFAEAAPPIAYGETYKELNRILDAEIASLKRNPAGESAFRPEISAELPAANSSRGESLLCPDTMDAVRLSLDRLKAMGIGTVRFALQYPLLRPDFPHSNDYLSFYKGVAAEAAKRNLKVMVHVSVLFADTPFSRFHGIYSGLSFGRFKLEYREMVHLIEKELHPDYLVLLSEPDTHARLTGLSEMSNPEKFAGIIRGVIDGLERGKTLIGAGCGSWNSPSFAEAVAQTDVDFVSIHIYPVTGTALSGASEMARTAHAYRKQVFIDEAWLYKTQKTGSDVNVASAADVFRNDIYSFWQPLDIKFMEMLLRFAGAERVDLVSFFWSGQFFAYSEYSSEFEMLSYNEIVRFHHRSVYRNMQSGKLSRSGEYLRNYIRSSGF